MDITKAEELLREGKPEEALSSLQEAIKKDPSNAKFRIFLFQLLSVLGRWDRALTQLNVAGELDASALPMVHSYRETIGCEMLRKEVFAGRKSPLIFGEPEEWLAVLMESLRITGEGHYEQGQELRNQAFEAAPASPGFLNGEAFEWIADADPRIGPVCEVIVQGRYYWLPFHQIREISMEEPTDLRDMVWTACNLTLVNGGTTVAFMPTRYPGSEESEDMNVRLSRRTDWQEKCEDLYVGLGQRLFATDAGEFALLDVRSVQLNVGEAADEVGTGEAPEKEDDAG